MVSIFSKEDLYEKKKQTMIDHNKKMINWLQSEIDSMTAWNQKSAATIRKIATYEWDIKRRNQRIAKHNKDIILNQRMEQKNE